MWALLQALAARDLSVARLVEGHLDAAAILAEHDPADSRAWRTGSRWGVWAAHPPEPRLAAVRTDEGWVLRGRKPWCSGAHLLTHAVVSADVDGAEHHGTRRLFAVSLGEPGCSPVPDSWPALGMRHSDSGAVDFADVPAEPVGDEGWYVSRTGFAYGGMQVAACWLGGAQGLADALWSRGHQQRLDEHALAHLGAVTAALAAARALLDHEAARVDADPYDTDGTALRRAWTVRAVVADAVLTVHEHVGRSLGAGPLCLDPDHAQRSADLLVYVRQHHAERDLAVLGTSAASEQEPPWWT